MQFPPFAVSVWCLWALSVGAGADVVTISPTYQTPYKTASGVTLRLNVFEPQGHTSGSRTPTVVLFHGGGWLRGSPGSLYPQCAYLASRGVVAIAPEYRVGHRHNTSPIACVLDGMSALRWIRQHADTLGTDPERMAAGGASAGGHIAALASFAHELREANENRGMGARPDALILFNPVTVLSPIDGRPEYDHTWFNQFRRRFQGVDLVSLSPYHRIVPNAPPTITFHGTGDTLVAHESSVMFHEGLAASGAESELHLYDDLPHGFFNYHYSERNAFRDTMAKVDRFLVALGYMQGEPTIEDFEVTAPYPWDVDASGVVDAADLRVLAREFGNVAVGNSADVNGDGIVDIRDLAIVGARYGDTTEFAPAAPPLRRTRGHAELLPNYPNPFNPETWVPFTLGEASNVTVNIYDQAGARIRSLDLGYRLAGNHTDRSTAAHWDGRNAAGEHITSGRYFYEMLAGDYRAVRRMVVRE
jgi:acetyl esterase